MVFRIRQLLLTGLFLVSLLALFSCKNNSRTKSSTAAVDSLPSCVSHLPKPTGWVMDLVFLYTVDQRRYLDSLIGQFENETTIEIGVLTIDSTRVAGKNLEDFAICVANAWGVGKKDKNNGIFVVISPSPHQLTIQNGYGIEKIITDAETKAIIDSSFVPSFKTGDYFNGIKKGLEAIMQLLRQKNKGEKPAPHT